LLYKMQEQEFSVASQQEDKVQFYLKRERERGRERVRE